MNIEEFNMLKETTKFDYYILVDKDYERPSSEDSEQAPTNKLQSNQTFIAEIVQNYSELRQHGEEIILSSMSNEELVCCSLSKNGKRCLCGFEIYQIRPYSYEILRAI